MTGSEPSTTIVVVDDFQDGRELMSATLRREGFDVKEAGTGEEALALAAERPALMVLDVHLPDIDGFEVCRRIKKDSRTAGISVLQVPAARVAAIQEAAERIREIVQQMLRVTKLELVQPPRPHVPDMLDLDRSTRGDSRTV